MSTKFNECHKKYKALRAVHEAAGEDGRVIDQLIARVTTLEEKVANLENQSLENQLAMWQQIAKQRQEEINLLKQVNGALTQQNHALQSELEHYAPSEVWPIRILPDEEAKEELERTLQPGEHIVSFQPGEEACMVSLSLAIRYGLEAHEFEFFKGAVAYPGTLEDFKREAFPQLETLTLRAPILEDVRSGKGGYPDAVSVEDISEACKQLTAFRYIEGAQHLYQEVLDNQFRARVKPKVDEVFNQLERKDRDPGKMARFEQQQRELFRECIDATFDQAEKKGRGKLGVKPVLKRGPLRRGE